MFRQKDQTAKLKSAIGRKIPKVVFLEDNAHPYTIVQTAETLWRLNKSTGSPSVKSRACLFSLLLNWFTQRGNKDPSIYLKKSDAFFARSSITKVYNNLIL